MKLKLFFTTVFTAVIYTINAQKISPDQSTIEFDKIDRACWQVEVVGEVNDVKKAWKNFLKKEFNIKLKGFGLFSNKDVLSAEKAYFSTVSTRTINLFTHFKGKVNPLMYVFASYYNDNNDFIGNSKEKDATFTKIKNEILNKFLKSYYPSYYSGSINNSVKEIKNLNSSIKKDTKSIKNAEEAIDDLKDKIIQLKENIVTNKAKVENSKKVLEEKRNKFDTVKKALENL